MELEKEGEGDKINVWNVICDINYDYSTLLTHRDLSLKKIRASNLGMYLPIRSPILNMVNRMIGNHNPL